MMNKNNKTTSVLVILVLLLAGLGRAEELNLSDYRPLLQVGQVWLVEVEHESEPPSVPPERLKDWKPTLIKTYYRFVVEERQEIDKESCFMIKIEVVKSSGEDASSRWFYRIFIRENDYTLKKVQRLSKGGPTVEASRNFSAGPVDAMDWVGVLPMDFPYFDPNAKEYEPKVEVSTDGKVKKRPMDILSQEVKESEIIIGKEKRRSVEIMLKDKTADEVKHETTQIWVKGMPWWIKAVYKQNGKEWCTARLIKVDGKDIIFQKPEDIKY